MHVNIRFLAPLVMLLITSTILFAQTKSSSESIGIDLGSGTFLGPRGLPFDVPFNIEGNVTPNLKQVSLSYTVKQEEVKKWMQFPKKVYKYLDTLKMPFSDETIWRQTDDFIEDQKFHLQLGPLHPNVTYQFNFKLIRTIDLSNDVNEELKKKILDVLYKYVDNISDVDTEEQTKANNKINLLLKQAVTPGAEILNLDHTQYRLDLNDLVLKPIINNMISQNRTIKRFDEQVTTISNEFANADYTVVKRKLAQLDTAHLDLASTAMYKTIAEPLIDQFRDVKMSDITKLLLDSSTDLSKIVKGTAKIEGKKIVPTDKFDPTSIKLLSKYFMKLIDIINNNNEPVFNVYDIAKLNNFGLALETAIADQDSLSKAKADRLVTLAIFPNVLEDKLISLSFVFFDYSNMDVVSEANPYVGLDFGTAFIPTYNQFFIYEGVNFYFAPVNKDAPLSRFSRNWRNILSKMISVHLGLTQNLVKVENKRYVPLIDNIGSLLIGVGIRVNRIVRINAGSMFFFQKDPNPLIDNNTLTSEFTTSLTIDLNVAKALGNIGKRVKVNH